MNWGSGCWTALVFKILRGAFASADFAKSLELEVPALQAPGLSSAPRAVWPIENDAEIFDVSNTAILPGAATKSFGCYALLALGLLRELRFVGGCANTFFFNTRLWGNPITAAWGSLGIF